MLQDQYPGLSAIEQGQDFGRGADIFFPFGPEDPRRVGRLTVTIGDPVVNLRRGLRQMRRPRPWPSCGSAGGWPISTSPFRLVGEIKNAGREWEPVGEPAEVNVHDFAGEAFGVALPFGVLDMSPRTAR